MGGAVFSRGTDQGGVVIITNSTIAGNFASGGLSGAGYVAAGNGKGLGGGVFNYNGSLTVTSSTFGYNTGLEGGSGIFSLGNGATPSHAVINNTIISADFGPSDLTVAVTPVGGTSTASGANNLIGTIVGTTLTGTLTGAPGFEGLGDNGGLTKTMALTFNSQAINAGADLAPSTDQRGFGRVGRPDIGAFEFGGVAPAQPQTITFGPLANRTYGDDDFALSATTTSGLPVRFTATGNASLREVAPGWWVAHITGAGTATITAHQDGNTSYAPAPDVARDFTIARGASVTTTVGAGPFTYNGSAQVGGSGTVTGAGGLNTSASLTYSAKADGTGVADFINAGTYYVTAHYAGDANHTASNGAAVAVVIGKADARVTVNGYTGVYDARFHGATGSAAGVGGESAGTLSLGATFKDVPGGTAHWAFTGNGNYKDQSGDVNIVITRKALTGVAKTQCALNTAKNGTLAFTIDVNAAGIVNARTVAQLYNGLPFTLSVGGSVYSVPATATVVNGRVHVRFAMTAQLKSFLAAHTTARNESNAPTVGLTLSAISSDGNYTLEATALTRLFNSK
jgi:hypothetical protein